MDFIESIFIIILLLFVIYFAGDVFAEIGEEKYNILNKRLNEYAELKPKFNDYFKDNKIVGYEYIRLNRRYYEIKKNKIKEKLK